MKTEKELEDPLESGPQVRKRKKRKRNLWPMTKNVVLDSPPIGYMLNYCFDCMTWDEAKPVVDMIEKYYGINAPPAVIKSLKKIRNKFHRDIYGKVIKAKTIVMKGTHIKGPLNKISNNNRVDLSK